ncbi:hybrid sensor histidine kinase/response regulator [Haloarchaeobius litoreus]|uniref:histidine kinase n=1 Tax=Haloarchaeobius litoreus TaxID=755306 RepID=A0ABD6DHC7_9EURY|nr:response regulator [Haloarchaeobius litoreus]
MPDDPRVLCVDDDRDTARMTAEYLQAAGIDCLVATNGEDALARLDEGRVDCVVSDYEMAGMDGIELLEAVRERDDRLPFIMFTGQGSESVASEAITAGVTDYLRRTDAGARQLLRRRIMNAVDQYRAERGLEDTRGRLEGLHHHAVALAGAHDRETVVDQALVAAERILDFDVSGVYVVEDGTFVPQTDRSYRPAGDLPTVDDGVLGRTYRERESVLVRNVLEDVTAEPDQPEFRSAVSVPIGRYGVFQAISEEPNAFSETDKELAELLVTHVTQAFDRLESESDLRRTNEQLRAILDNTTANIYIKGLDGRYQLINDRFRELLGLEPGEAVGRTDFELQDEEYAEEVRENDQLAVERGEPIQIEETGEFEGDERIYYSVKVPLYGDDGAPVGVCGISSDITELKERERELERQKERLDEFAHLVSHDLRSPLSVARGYLDLVRDEVDHEHLTEIANAHDRMENIIDGVLTLAREGREIGERYPVSVEAVARGAWGNVDSGAATLSVVDDTTVDADRDRLLQVFENLYRNALAHALPDDADRVLTVTVGTLATSGFYVADDGDGVPASVRDGLFDPGQSSDPNGTGFGLAIVERVVSAHGWTVELADSADGGARFEIRT